MFDRSLLLIVATAALCGPAAAWDVTKRGRYGGLDADRLEAGSVSVYDRIDVVGVLAASREAVSAVGSASQDSRAFLDDANTNGPYTDFDSKANSRETFDNTEVIPQKGSGALRDLRYLRMRDRDPTNYPANFRVVSNLLRLTNAGLVNSAGTFVPQRKDLHGVWATAIGNSAGVDRGMSGLLGEAIQLGTGVATNEFSAMAPGYGAAQPALLAPVIGILYNYKANADAAHKAWGLQANLYGFQSTAAFRAASVPAHGQPGAAQIGMQMDELVVSGAAITMPQPLAGTAKGIIDYGGATSRYDTAANAFVWSVGGAEVGRIDGGAWADWAPALTCRSGRLTAGTAAGRYRRSGKTVHFSAKVSIATNGTCAGSLILSLPLAAYSTGGAQFAGNGYEDAISGAALQVRGAGSSLRLTRYDNAYMGGDGAVLVVSGTYEAAP